ncbi:MAG: glycosyltransferase family 2 protein [Gammaproteobacteria bacterium]|nr:glycosyltransferase family 2 protein [Gammaproteobacteria bacterium]
MIENDDGSNNSEVVVTAVVINWNTRELLRECLARLESAAKHVPLHIVVVDNASEDASADMVVETYPDVALVRNHQNVGFARANNLAFERARGRYLLIINPDARLEDAATLKRWLGEMERDSRIAASGAYLTDAEARHRLGDAGFRPTWRSMLGLYWFLGRLSTAWFPPYFLYRQDSAGVDVDWVSGAAMLVRRSCLDDVGVFDDQVFMYGEDVEWCCRMRDHGYRVVHLPRIRVTHFEGASTRQQKHPGFSILWFRQLRALYFHYQPGQPAWIFDVIVLVGLSIRVVGYNFVSLYRGSEFSRSRVGQHLACLRFICRQFGRRGEPWPGSSSAVARALRVPSPSQGRSVE